MIEAVDTAQTTSSNKILIVGGSGYLGRFLIDGFARAGWNVSFTFKTCYDLDFNRGFAVRGYKVRRALLSRVHLQPVQLYFHSRNHGYCPYYLTFVSNFILGESYYRRRPG